MIMDIDDYLQKLCRGKANVRKNNFLASSFESLLDFSSIPRMFSTVLCSTEKLSYKKRPNIALSDHLSPSSFLEMNSEYFSHVNFHCSMNFSLFPQRKDRYLKSEEGQ